jgi:hypothetical protein
VAGDQRNMGVCGGLLEWFYEAILENRLEGNRKKWSWYRPVSRNYIVIGHDQLEKIRTNKLRLQSRK